MFPPTFTRARGVRRHRIDGFDAMLMTDLSAEGLVVYKHALVVARSFKHESVLIVTLESTVPEPCEIDGTETPSRSVPPHFFCWFEKSGISVRHANAGPADELIDLDAFETRALGVAREYLARNSLG